MSLPGSLALSNAVFLKVNSRALLAASLAFAAKRALEIICLAICGFSSKNVENPISPVEKNVVRTAFPISEKSNLDNNVSFKENSLESSSKSSEKQVI